MILHSCWSIFIFVLFYFNCFCSKALLERELKKKTKKKEKKKWRSPWKPARRPLVPLATAQAAAQPANCARASPPWLLGADTMGPRASLLSPTDDRDPSVRAVFFFLPKAPDSYGRIESYPIRPVIFGQLGSDRLLFKHRGTSPPSIFPSLG